MVSKKIQQVILGEKFIKIRGEKLEEDEDTITVYFRQSAIVVVKSDIMSMDSINENKEHPYVMLHISPSAKLMQIISLDVSVGQVPIVRTVSGAGVSAQRKSGGGIVIQGADCDCTSGSGNDCSVCTDCYDCCKDPIGSDCSDV